MSERDDGVARRLRWAAPLTAVLVLLTGTAAADALWERRAPLTAGVVTTGTLSATAVWIGSPAAPLFPGRSTDVVLRVTETGVGENLRWRLRATTTVSGVSPPSVTMQTFVGACGTGTPLAAGAAYAPPGGYARGTTVDLCIRIALPTTSPPEEKGRTFTADVAVTVEQIVS